MCVRVCMCVCVCMCGAEEKNIHRGVSQLHRVTLGNKP